jgi:hypothetical protein
MKKVIDWNAYWPKANSATTSHSVVSELVQAVVHIED